MGERTRRVVRNVRSLFEDWSIGIREERVIQFIIDELRRGRDFDSILEEPWVIEHTTPEDRRRLLFDPSIIRGIEDQIAGELFMYRVEYEKESLAREGRVQQQQPEESVEVAS